MSQFKVKVDVSEFREVVKKFRQETTSTTFARKVSHHLTELSDKLAEHIRNKLIENNEMPKSYVFTIAKNVSPVIKFKLPKRLKYPRSRTGNLRNSIKVFRGEKTSIKGLQNYKQVYVSLYVGISKRNKYGAILEEGGIITPKKSKYLAIPLDRESWGKSPREFDFLKVYKRKFLIRRTGRKTYKALYLLKSSVEIKPFHYIKDGYKEFIKSREYITIINNLEKDLSKWLKYSLKRKS